jgi:hypothetical protein
LRIRKIPQIGMGNFIGSLDRVCDELAPRATPRAAHARER